MTQLNKTVSMMQCPKCNSEWRNMAKSPIKCPRCQHKRQLGR